MSNDQYSNQPPVDPNYQANQTPSPNQPQLYQPYSQTPSPNQPQPYQPYSQPIQPQSQGQFVVPSGDQLVRGFKGLSLGRRLAIGGGLVAWLGYLLPWYSFSSAILGFRESSSVGLSYFWPWLGFLALTAVLVNLIAPLFGKQIYPLIQRTINLPLGKAVFYGLAAALGLALIGGFIGKPSDMGFAEIDVSFSFGFYLSILALGAATAGGWLMQQSSE
jgi:hypothetical protein